jgi:hypothetical protein
MRTKTHTRYTELWTTRFTVLYRLVLLCTSNDIHTAWLYGLLLFLVWILNFPLSIIHGKEDFYKWMLYVHVERIRIPL